MEMPAGGFIQNRGFTLIELMIVVAIVATLASVAYPSYLAQVRKGRRADAVQALSQLQQAQERWRANNPTYANNTQLTLAPTASPPGLGLQATTAGGNYTLAISTGTPPTGTAYTATATALSSSSQYNDSAGSVSCRVLTMAVANGNATLTPAECWSK